MNLEQLPEMAEKTLTMLSEKLSVPVEQLLTIAVHGVRVAGVVQVLVGIITAFSFWFGVKIWFDLLTDNDIGEFFRYFVIGLFGGALLLILFLVFMESFKTGSMQSFAPEYWILKQILNY